MLKRSGSALKKIINASLHPIGLALVREKGRSSMPIWSDRIRHAKSLGFLPKSIVDGGAYRGFWTLEAAKIFPDAQILTVEPNPFIQEELSTNVSNIEPLPKLVNVALGETQGTATFNIWREEKLDTGASLLNHVSGAAQKSVDVEVDTLDNVVSQTNLMPDFVKLDLQGAELMALKGARNVLQHAELMMIEFGCLEAYEERATSRELMEVMYDNDYCLYDIVDCHYRPYDGALTGGDYIFVKNSSVLRKYKGWE